MKNNPRYEVLCEQSNVHSLLIPEAFPEDSGWYMCRATNVAGTTSSEVQLIVEGMFLISIRFVVSVQMSHIYLGSV